MIYILKDPDTGEVMGTCNREGAAGPDYVYEKKEDPTELESVEV